MDEKPDRRKVLKGIAIAGAAATTLVLPEEWTRPSSANLSAPVLYERAR